jgi:hypothetical protein
LPPLPTLPGFLAETKNPFFSFSRELLFEENVCMAFALNGEGALWDAVSDGDVAQVKRLLESNADPNMTCPDSFVRTEMAPKATGTGKSLVCCAWMCSCFCVGGFEAIVCVYARAHVLLLFIVCVCVNHVIT